MQALQGLTADALFQCVEGMKLAEARKILTAVHRRHHSFEHPAAPIDGARPAKFLSIYRPQEQPGENFAQLACSFGNSTCFW